jgi:hypothetical protein
MDLSKLPRLSKTETPAPDVSATPPEPPPAPLRRGAFCDRCGAALRAGARFCDGCGTPVAGASLPRDRDAGDDVPAGVGVDVWFSLVLGIIFALLGRTYAQYLLATLRHQPFHTGVEWTSGPKLGQEVPYAELEGAPMLTDSAMFLFGAALLLDAAVRFLVVLRVPGRAVLMGVALLGMVAATLYNAYVCVHLYRTGTIPLISLLCVGFGGYIAFMQWVTLRTLLMVGAQKVAPGAGKTPGAQGR